MQKLLYRERNNVKMKIHINSSNFCTEQRASGSIWCDVLGDSPRNNNCLELLNHIGPPRRCWLSNSYFPFKGSIQGIPCYNFLWFSKGASDPSSLAYSMSVFDQNIFHNFSQTPQVSNSWFCFLSTSHNYTRLTLLSKMRNYVCVDIFPGDNTHFWSLNVCCT